MASSAPGRIHASWVAWRAGHARLPFRDGQQLLAREYDQARRLDADRPLSLEALELLVDALARRAQELRQVLLRELQADADLFALLDAVALREQDDLLGQAG